MAQKVAHYVNSRKSISLVRSTSHCLRGSQNSSFPFKSSAGYTYDQTEGIYTLLQHEFPKQGTYIYLFTYPKTFTIS
jgi:hypothetical protein